MLRRVPGPATVPEIQHETVNIVFPSTGVGIIPYRYRCVCENNQVEEKQNVKTVIELT